MNSCLSARILTGGGGIYAFVDGFIKAHPKAGGLAVNWCLFGSSGHITKPEGGIIENYTNRAKDDYDRNHSFKTICDPLKVWIICSHSPLCRWGFRIMSDDGSAALGSTTYDIHLDKIRINHYFTKSREEFIAKVKRGKADMLSFRSVNEFDEQDRNEVHDTEILSHL